MVHERGTRTDLAPPFPKDTRSPRQICEADGGFWDVKTQTCLTAKPKPIVEPKPSLEVVPEVGIQQPEIFTSKGTGRPSGITIPGVGGKPDRDFLGLTPKEVEKIAGIETSRGQLPEGTVPVGTAAAQAAETQRRIALARTVGVIDFQAAQEIESQGLNVRELVAAGFQSIDLKVPALAIGAGLSTAPVTAGVSVGVGFAAAGGSIINDFQKGVRQNIKSQRQDLVTGKTKELRVRKQAIQNYITIANMNPAQADDMAFNMKVEQTLIRHDFDVLIRESQENLEFWGGDATLQIMDYEAFFESYEPSLEDRMRQAILKPDPSRAFISLEEEDLT